MKYFRDFLVFRDLLSQSRKGKRSWSFIITFYSKRTAILHFFNIYVNYPSLFALISSWKFNHISPKRGSFIYLQVPNILRIY